MQNDSSARAYIHALITCLRGNSKIAEDIRLGILWMLKRFLELTTKAPTASNVKDIFAALATQLDGLDLGGEAAEGMRTRLMRMMSSILGLVLREVSSYFYR